MNSQNPPQSARERGEDLYRFTISLIHWATKKEQKEDKGEDLYQ